MLGFRAMMGHSMSHNEQLQRLLAGQRGVPEAVNMHLALLGWLIFGCFVVPKKKPKKTTYEDLVVGNRVFQRLQRRPDLWSHKAHRLEKAEIL